MTDAKLPSVKRMMKALGGLYTDEYGDWLLEVSHILTEPTCPTAIIRAECGEAPSPIFRADADTISKAIKGAVTAAYVTLILRQDKPQTVPWSEQGDSLLTGVFGAIDRAFAAHRRREEKEANCPHPGRVKKEELWRCPTCDGYPNYNPRKHR
jgi:hypothetical protein